MHAQAEGMSGPLMTNIVMTVGVGAVIDANNGATQKLVPNPLVVTLEPDTVRGAQTTTQRVADELLDRAGRQ